MTQERHVQRRVGMLFLEIAEGSAHSFVEFRLWSSRYNLCRDCRHVRQKVAYALPCRSQQCTKWGWGGAHDGTLSCNVKTSASSPFLYIVQAWVRGDLGDPHMRQERSRGCELPRCLPHWYVPADDASKRPR